MEDALLQVGLSGDAARALAALGKYALHLAPRGGGTGFSKVGGVPDLPTGMAWPIRPSFPPVEDAPKGLVQRVLGKLFSAQPSEAELRYRNSPQPYNFIAQIAFREMASLVPESLDLPTTGALYLFYDDLSQCWGFDPNDAIGFKVIYAPDISKASPAERPEVQSDVPSYTEVRVEPKLRFEHCPSEGIHFDALSLSEADIDAYVLFEDQADERGRIGWPSLPAHKVSGWTNNIQGPMEGECALVTSGIYCGGPEGYASEEAKRFLSEPNDWILLLQIDSDDGAGMMWGDAGMLYLWIKTSDLIRGNFDNTWLILQSG